jgi:hypothetical protein
MIVTPFTVPPLIVALSFAETTNHVCLTSHVATGGLGQRLSDWCRRYQRWWRRQELWHQRWCSRLELSGMGQHCWRRRSDDDTVVERIWLVIRLDVINSGFDTTEHVGTAWPKVDLRVWKFLLIESCCQWLHLAEKLQCRSQRLTIDHPLAWSRTSEARVWSKANQALWRLPRRCWPCCQKNPNSRQKAGFLR